MTTCLKRLCICWLVLISSLGNTMKPDEMFTEIGGIAGKIPAPLVLCAKLASEQKFDEAAVILSDFKNVLLSLDMQVFQEFSSSKEGIERKLTEHYDKVKKNYDLEDSPYDKEFSVGDFVYYTLLGDFYWDYNNLLTTRSLLTSKVQTSVDSFIRLVSLSSDYRI